MKLGLQIILGTLSVIPLVVSILGVTQGTALFLPDSAIMPRFDSQYRYITGYYITLSLIVWWILPQIEKHTMIFRIVCGGVFFGGIGRLLSILQVGIPNAVVVGVTCLELFLPLLCIWQSKLSNSSRQKIMNR